MDLYLLAFKLILAHYILNIKYFESKHNLLYPTKF